MLCYMGIELASMHAFEFENIALSFRLTILSTCVLKKKKITNPFAVADISI